MIALTQTERVLHATRLLSAADAPLVAELARVATRRHFARGEWIWRAGQPAHHFTVIVSGTVKIVRPQANGGNTIVGLFGARDTVGDMAVFSNGTYPADAVALSEGVEILYIDKAIVLDRLEHDAALAGSCNQALVEHTRALQDKIRILSAGPVERRLATLLLYLCERFGDELEGGALTIPMALSRSDLASLVGSTVETTIRAMSRWQKAGLVSTSDDGFLVHRREELERLAATP